MTTARPRPGIVQLSGELEFVYATTAYPSELQVAGVGTVQDLDVTLHGFTSTFPADLDLLLVGPTGAPGDRCCPTPAAARRPRQHRADAATTRQPVPLPDAFADPLTRMGATDRPTWMTVPATTSTRRRRPAPTGATALSVFDGTDPNGTWRLFAVDDVSATSRASRAAGRWPSSMTTPPRPRARSRSPAVRLPRGPRRSR